MANTNKTDSNSTTHGKEPQPTAATGDERARKDGVPSNNVAVPIQVVDRDEIRKDEYQLKDGKLEIERGHPNYIFDNQRNQQAQENTVEIAAGIRNDDGTLKENHPQADDANPAVVSKDSDGTEVERRNRENLKK
jgi:hypothetical protein